MYSAGQVKIIIYLSLNLPQEFLHDVPFTSGVTYIGTSLGPGSSVWFKITLGKGCLQKKIDPVFFEYRILQFYPLHLYVCTLYMMMELNVTFIYKI